MIVVIFVFPLNLNYIQFFCAKIKTAQKQTNGYLLVILITVIMKLVIYWSI